MGGGLRLILVLTVCAAASFLGGIVGGGLVPGTATAENAKSLTVNRLDVVDGQGRTVIALQGDREEGPTLVIQAPDGEKVVGLGIRNGRPALLLQQKPGDAVFLGYAEKGPRIEFHADSRQRAFFGLYQDGPVPAMTLFDENGIPRAMLALGDAPHLTFADPKGKPYRQVP